MAPMKHSLHVPAIPSWAFSFLSTITVCAILTAHSKRSTRLLLTSDIRHHIKGFLTSPAPLSLSHTHIYTYKTHISLGHIGSINNYIRLTWIHVSSSYAYNLVTPVVPTEINSKKKLHAADLPGLPLQLQTYGNNTTDHTRSSHVWTQRWFYIDF
jgi:hypothetical protein